MHINTKHNENYDQYYYDHNKPYYTRDTVSQPEPIYQSRRQKEPKPFDGNKVQWSDYLKQFEIIANYNRWDSRMKAQNLVMNLEGSALRMISELSPETLENFEELVFEMNRRYDPSERIGVWKIEFRNRVKQANESLMQYAQELKLLAIKAYPNFPTIAHEQFVLDQFLLGISSFEMKRHVQFMHPKTVNEAVSFALEYETFEMGNKFRKPLIQNSGAIHVVAERPEEDKSKIECFYCKKKGHYKSNCLKLKQRQEREQVTNRKNQGN